MAQQIDETQQLYNNLKEDGYDDIGTLDEFREKVSDRSMSDQLYNNLKKDGYEDLGTDEEFFNRLNPQQENLPSAQPEVPNVTGQPEKTPGSEEWRARTVGVPGENPYNGQTYGAVYDSIIQDYGKNLAHPDVDPYAEARAQIMQAGITDDLNPEEADRLALNIREGYANRYAQNGAREMVSALPDQVPDIDSQMDGLWYNRDLQGRIAHEARRLGLPQEVYVNQYVKPQLAKALSDRYGYDVESARHIAGRLMSQEGHTMERVRQNEAESMTGKYIAPYIQEYFDKAMQTADAKYKAETSGAGAYTPTGLPNGQMVVADIRRYQATDPAKIWEEMKPNIDQMAQSIVGSPEFFAEAMEHADEEGVETTKWIKNRIMPVIIPQIKQQFEQMAIEREMPKNTMEYIWANIEQSLVGTIARTALESQARRRMKAEALQRTEAGQGTYQPGFAARIGGGTAAMFPDMVLPFGGPFGITAKMATKPVRGMAQKLITDGMRPILARMAESAASGSLSLGAFEGVKGGVEEMFNPSEFSDYMEGSDRSSSEILKDALLNIVNGEDAKRFIKGAFERGVPSAVSGAAMVGGPIGQKISSGRGALANILGWGTQVGIDAAGATALSTIPKIVTGDVTLEDVGREFASNVGTFAALGLHGKAKEFASLADGGKSWNGVEFTKKDIETLEDRYLIPLRKQIKEIESAQNRLGNIERATLGIDATEAQREAVNSLGTTMYNDLMHSYAVPRDLKVKVSQALGVPIPEYALKPDVLQLSKSVEDKAIDLGWVDAMNYDYNKPGGVAEKVMNGEPLSNHDLTLRLIFQDNAAYDAAVKKQQAGEPLTEQEQDLVETNNNRLIQMRREYEKSERGRMAEEFERLHGLEPGTLSRMLRDLAEGKGVDSSLMNEYENMLRDYDAQLGVMRAARDEAEAVPQNETPSEASGQETADAGTGEEVSVPESEVQGTDQAAESMPQPETPAGEAASKRSFELNDEITITDDNGTVSRGFIASVPTVSDGTFAIQTSNGKMIYRNADYLQSHVSEHNGETIARETKPEENGNNSLGNIPSEGNNEGEIIPEQQTTALSRIPVNEKGQPDYERAKAEDSFDALVEELGEEDAVAIANSEMEDAQKRLNRLQKQGVKGETIEEKKKSLSQRAAAMKEQQAKIDYWTSVLEVPKARKAEAYRIQAEEAARKAEAERREKMQTPEGRLELLGQARNTQERAAIAKEIYGDYFNENTAEPDTVEELVSLLLPYGKLNWEGYDRGIYHVRGLQEELGSQHTRGWSKDRGTSGFNSYLAKKGEDESLDTVVDGMYRDDANLVGDNHRFTTEEIRDAVLDMLLSAEKPSDIRNYTLNSRIDVAEKTLKAEIERMNEEIENERETEAGQALDSQHPGGEAGRDREAGQGEIQAQGAGEETGIHQEEQAASGSETGAGVPPVSDTDVAGGTPGIGNNGEADLPFGRQSEGEAPFHMVGSEGLRPQTAVDKAIRDVLTEQIRKSGAEGIEVIEDIAEAEMLSNRSDAKKQQNPEPSNDSGEKIHEHRVYHGSRANFDVFDHSHMGEGEGTQAFGWGTYVSTGHGVAKGYAKSLIGPYSDDAIDIVLLEKEIKGRQDKDKMEQRYLSEKEAYESIGWEPLSREEYFEENEKKLAEAKRLLNEIYDRLSKGNYIYDVEIPDENEAYYIDYYGKMGDQKDILDMVDNKLTADGWKRQEIDSRIKFTKGGKQIILTPNQSGADLYAELSDALGSDKAASEFLYETGITGNKYPAGTIMGGGGGATNYVIFNENDAKITDKRKLFRTKDGEAYGFTLNGKIYIDPRIATSETPIHEYGHLWAAMKRKTAPKEWDQIKGVLMNDKMVQPFVDKVREEYPELAGKEDDFIEEVLTQFSGRHGSERLRQIADEIRQEMGGDAAAKTIAEAAVRKMKGILDKFWRGIADMMGWQYTSAEDIADRMLYDLLSGKNPNEEIARAKEAKKAVDSGIYSDNFKKFFGDWESDAEDASKIVDASGKPMVVYHQTDNDFTVFDPRHEGAGTRDYELPFGIFMKPTPRNIGVRGEKQMPLYANIRKPLRVEDREELSDWLKQNVDGYKEAVDEYNRIDQEYSKKFEEAEKADHEEYVKNWNKWKAGEITEEQYQESFSSSAEDVLEEWKEAIKEPIAKAKKLVDDYFRDSEYDGVWINKDEGSLGRSTETIVALDPNQVKSATENNGEYNPDNPDIRFQRVISDDIKPVGSNRFGGVYDQFKGKVKEAFDFLVKKKDGYLMGVFHRDDLGDIDLAWGSAPTNYTGKGLAHIIRKHIEVLKDFKDLDEAMQIINDVVDNGTAKQNSDPKLVDIEKGNYRVVVAKNTEGNWILSAFDFVNPKKEKAKGKTLPPSKTPGQSDVEAGAVTSNLSLSEGKDTKNINTLQENQEKSSELGKTSSPEQIKEEELSVNVNPTEGQKEAGNYKMGHISLDGYNITIENPKGSVRSGVDGNGKAWRQEMHNTYGYIRGTEGVDGDHIDVFLSDDPTGGKVYVVDQADPKTGEFDEHKIMYGFGSEEEARQAYLSNYEEGWKGLGNITEVSKEDFKKWVESSHRKTKPFADYKIAKQQPVEEPEGQDGDGIIRFQRVSPPAPDRTGDALDRVMGEVGDRKDAERLQHAELSKESDIARQTYEKAVAENTLKFQEAWQDSMISLKKLQEAIEAETGNKAEGAEDAYSFENRMHGRAKNMSERFEWQHYQPMLKAFDELAKDRGMSVGETMDYLIAKHGLERNAYYAFRDAVKQKVHDETEVAKEKLNKQYAKGKISEEDYKAKMEELYNVERTSADDALAELRASDAYQTLKAAYDSGRNSYADFLKGVDDLKRAATMRKTPRKDKDGNIVSTNYYDDYAADYSGLTDTFAKELYDAAQRTKRRAQSTVDPKAKKELWKQYNREMREAYQTALQFVGKSIEKAEGSQPSVPFGETAAGRLWDRINAATKETLRTSYESGMMDRNTYNKVRNMFDYYVPLRGWEENKASDVYSYMGKANVFSPAVKKTWGRTSKAENPLAYIGNIATSTILSGHRNLLKQHFLNYVMNNPTSLTSVSESWYENIGHEDGQPVWVLRTADTAGKSADEIADIVNDFNEEMAMKEREGKAIPVRGRLRLDVNATQGQKAEHVVEVQRNGHTYQIYINGDPKAAQALNGTAAKAVSRISDTFLGKELGNLNRSMAAFFTSKNPAFVLSNLSRDLNMAGASVAVNEGKEYNERFMKNVVKVLRPRMGESSSWVSADRQPTGLMPDLMRKYKNGTLDEGDETERYFKEFMEEGGETGFVNMLSVDSFKEKMQDEIKQMQGSDIAGRGGKETSVRKGLRLMGETFEFYNRCAEDATRFIVYMTSRQEGKTMEQSIADAKDVTLNFNRKGTGGMGNAEVRDLFIFVNPAIQALANMYRMGKGHPLKLGATAMGFMAGGAMMPVLNQWLLNMFGDDDDKQSYWNLPPWVRKNNLVMWIPGTKNFITIPLAQEFRVFYGTGEMISSAVMEHPTENMGLELASSVADLIPINPTGNGGNLMVDFAPTGIQPLMQLNENTDFTGKPIWKENQGNKHDPAYTKAYAGTPKWMVKVAEKLNDWTGGNEGRKGWIEDKLPGGAYLNNPAVWNHLLQGYLGGMYNTIAKGFDTVYTGATGVYDLATKGEAEWPNVYQVPVLNRFVNRPSERKNAGALGEEYWDLVNESDKVNNELNTMLQKAADGDEDAKKRVDEIAVSDEYRRSQVIGYYKGIIDRLRKGEQAATQDIDRQLIKESIGHYVKEMEDELTAIGNGTDPLEQALEMFDKATTLSEKDELRRKIEKMSARKKVKPSNDAVEQALNIGKDEEKESREGKDEYLMRITSDDLRKDAEINDLQNAAKEAKDDKLNECYTSLKRRISYRKSHWFGSDKDNDKAINNIREFRDRQLKNILNGTYNPKSED